MCCIYLHINHSFVPTLQRGKSGFTFICATRKNCYLAVQRDFYCFLLHWAKISKKRVVHLIILKVFKIIRVSPKWKIRELLEFSESGKVTQFLCHRHQSERSFSFNGGLQKDSGYGLVQMSARKLGSPEISERWSQPLPLRLLHCNVLPYRIPGSYKASQAIDPLRAVPQLHFKVGGHPKISD